MNPQNKTEPKNEFKSKFDNLRDKFSNKTEPEFPIQKEAYIKEDIDLSIREFERNLLTEIELSKKLDSNMEEKILDAKKFYKDNKDTIEEQFDKICKLEENLMNIKKENIERQQLDKDYYKLVNTSEFKNMSEKIKKINTKIKNLDFFLIKNGVKDYTN